MGVSPRFSEPTTRNPAVLLGLGAGGRICPRGGSGVCTAGSQEVPGKPVFRMALTDNANYKIIMMPLTFAVCLDISCFIYSFIQQIFIKCQLCTSSGVTVRKKMD